MLFSIKGKPKTRGTQKFVRICDKIFDCLNGQYPNQDMATRKPAKPALRQYTETKDKCFEWLTDTFLKSGKTEAPTPGLQRRKEKRRLYLAIQTVERLHANYRSCLLNILDFTFWIMVVLVSQPQLMWAGRSDGFFYCLNYCYLKNCFF